MKRITMVKSNKKTLEEGFNEFIRHCRIKNLSEKTIEFYERYFKQFDNYLSERDINFINEIDASVINDYILFQKTRSIRDISINSNIRAIRAIIYLFQELGYCSHFKITQIKADKALKETYSEQELKILLAKPKIDSFTEYKCWVVTNFLLATGVRVGELVGIQIKDIYLDEAIVKIKRGKSRRERHVPLAKTLLKLLQEYMNYRQYQSEEDYLFCNVYGGKLAEDSLKHSTAAYNRKRGVNKTSLHLYRHTFSKNWILNGGDIFRLQKILGHRSLEIVKEYVNMFGDDLSRDFDKFNPLEQIVQKGEWIKMK